MTRYRNGQIPASVLIKIASGTNGDGYWEHLLSPSQKRKHDALVARARKRTGRTLKITSGWNAYRPLEPQWTAKRKYGSGAAWPGTSSHGGTYKGADAMAMDYGNWSWVYGGDRAAFFADCRAVGLDPGVISDELWHVIDRDPWAPVPASLPKTDPATPEEDEEHMYIANVKNGNFYMVIGKQAHALGAASGARESGIPIINYVDDWAVKQLKAGGVTGIGNH